MRAVLAVAPTVKRYVWGISRKLLGDMGSKYWSRWPIYIVSKFEFPTKLQLFKTKRKQISSTFMTDKQEAYIGKNATERI